MYVFVKMYAFTELEYKAGHLVPITLPIEEYIKKHGYTPECVELSKLFNEGAYFKKISRIMFKKGSFWLFFLLNIDNDFQKKMILQNRVYWRWIRIYLLQIL